MAMIAAAIAPIPATDGDGAVGALDTSMVEMLGSVDSANVMTMAEMRQMIANSSQVTTAGHGIDVAVIDTGVAPVAGLDGEDKVLHGPDLSFEGASPEAAYLDTYGHGTHMAAIIAGDRPDAPGIAPGARIVSVKVAGHDGVTTVPQVVAAIDWVVEHRNSDGLNIRVLNLSLGQAGVNNHVGDYLSAAVERAWDAGIVVVVAAGNRGESQNHLDSPAIDPYVISVGALATTLSSSGYDNTVPGWSATGNGKRDPNATAPGQSIASYRVPGSSIDSLVPEARYGDAFFLGSGTSQAAAVTSGIAAAMLQYHPEYTPDKVKATLEYRAVEIDPNSKVKDGEGAVHGVYSVVYGGPSFVAAQNHTKADQPSHITTPTGSTWSGGTWSGSTWSGSTWSGSTWSGGTWSGSTWSGATWSGSTWSGSTWSGSTWSGATWSGNTWSGATWSGSTWSGNGWS